MRWILLDGISFRGATSPNFRPMLETAAPIVNRFVPQSHSTIPAWLDLEYYHAFAAMQETLKTATSLIHLSFDV